MRKEYINRDINGTNLVRFIENDRFSRIDFRTIEELEHNFKQGTCCTGTDKPMRTSDCKYGSRQYKVLWHLRISEINDGQAAFNEFLFRLRDRRICLDTVRRPSNLLA